MITTKNHLAIIQMQSLRAVSVRLDMTAAPGVKTGERHLMMPIYYIEKNIT